MAVNPKEIVERQLELLKAQSDKGPITFEECQSLERLIKLQILIKIKDKGKGIFDEDPFKEVSSEDLQKLLPLLSD